MRRTTSALAAVVVTAGVIAISGQPRQKPQNADTGTSDVTRGRVVFSDAFGAVRRSVLLEMPYVDDIPVSEDQVWGKTVTGAGWAMASKRSLSQASAAFEISSRKKTSRSE